MTNRLKLTLIPCCFSLTLIACGAEAPEGAATEQQNSELRLGRNEGHRPSSERHGHGKHQLDKRGKHERKGHENHDGDADDDETPSSDPVAESPPAHAPSEPGSEPNEHASNDDAAHGDDSTEIAEGDGNDGDTGDEYSTGDTTGSGSSQPDPTGNTSGSAGPQPPTSSPGIPGGASDDGGYWYGDPGVCGDGAVTWWSEQCDDGNTEPGDGCNENCGVEPGWVCDGASPCRQAVCGDGMQDYYLVEYEYEVLLDEPTMLGEPPMPGEPTVLDDAGTFEVTAASGETTSPMSPSAIGYYYVWENCDDGNTEAGDGCSANCEVEPGWACRGDVCRVAACGDGFQDYYSVEVSYDDGDGNAGTYTDYRWESCDDGNNEDGDGCTKACDPETGYVCEAEGEPCRPVVCGDGLQDSYAVAYDCGSGMVMAPAATPVSGLDAGSAPDTAPAEECWTYYWESCDDGNADAGDGCNASCEVEPGWVCDYSGEPCRLAVCGDGILDWQYESCEDGNTEAGDGCDAGCQIEPGWVCDYSGEPCRLAVCGDGIVDWQVESCDDSNTEAGDGCDADCQVEPGWVCDDWSQPCRQAVCGDGIFDWQLESCDDGNTEPGDGCDASCVPEPGYECDWGMCWESYCGDGLVDPGEECDDGNVVDDDGCTDMCTLPACGDGIVGPGEECDDGNDANDDGCSNSCQLSP